MPWLPARSSASASGARRFVVLLNEQMAEEQAVEILGHDWANPLVWNYSLDRMAHCRIWTPPRSTAWLMIDVYHCPKCSRLLSCDGVVSILGDELPLFQCEDCIIKRAIFGPGTDAIEMAYTFCVDSAGQVFDPTEELCEGNHEPESDYDTEPDVSRN
jgi:hypothetical protein